MVIVLILGWIKMMVNPGPAEGTGIVVDTYGHPHIFYYKNNAIYHSFWNGGWYEEYRNNWVYVVDAGQIAI
ncbi:MAG: hypothetical protein ABIM41_02475 [candidate division WOR-3 bacterium]